MFCRWRRWSHLLRSFRVFRILALGASLVFVSVCTTSCTDVSYAVAVGGYDYAHCTCSNGIASNGSCLANGTSCAYCNLGFHLNGAECQRVWPVTLQLKFDTSMVQHTLDTQALEQIMLNTSILAIKEDVVSRSISSRLAAVSSGPGVWRNVDATMIFITTSSLANEHIGSLIISNLGNISNVSNPTAFVTRGCPPTLFGMVSGFDAVTRSCEPKIVHPICQGLAAYIAHKQHVVNQSLFNQSLPHCGSVCMDMDALQNQVRHLHDLSLRLLSACCLPLALLFLIACCTPLLWCRGKMDSASVCVFHVLQSSGWIFICFIALEVQMLWYLLDVDEHMALLVQSADISCYESASVFPALDLEGILGALPRKVLWAKTLGGSQILLWLPTSLVACAGFIFGLEDSFIDDDNSYLTCLLGNCLCSGLSILFGVLQFFLLLKPIKTDTDRYFNRIIESPPVLCLQAHVKEQIGLLKDIDCSYFEAESLHSNTFASTSASINFSCVCLALLLLLSVLPR